MINHFAAPRTPGGQRRRGLPPGRRRHRRPAPAAAPRGRGHARPRYWMLAE